MSEKKKQPGPDPVFTRGDVAKILNVTALTIANREKSKKYPSPSRDLNNYRVYNINDVFNLQLITYSEVDPKPIISVLYDKGYTDTKGIARIIDSALSRKTNSTESNASGVAAEVSHGDESDG